MTTDAAPRPGRLDEIPIVDLAESDMKALAATVRLACENSAFFYIANHGVAPDVIEGAFAAGRMFFQLPLEEKMKIYKNRFHRGYQPLGTTRFPGQKKDLKHSFDFGIDLPLDDPDVIIGLPFHGSNQWPELPGFRAALETYFSGIRAAGMKLMRVLAIGLDLEDDFFAKLYGKPSIVSRVIHYPMPEISHADEFGIGAIAHTDYGHITVLAQDPAGGLEVQLPTGEWIAAPYVPDTLVVNLGDLMARWTNDIYRSNPHRVVNRLNRDRISIPTFLTPDHRSVIGCIPTCSGPENPPKYEPVLAGEYVANKIRDNQGYKLPQAQPPSSADDV